VELEPKRRTVKTLRDNCLQMLIGYQHIVHGICSLHEVTFLENRTLNCQQQIKRRIMCNQPDRPTYSGRKNL